MEAAIKSVLPVYAVGRWTYAGKVLMLFLTNKDHQSPTLAVGKASLAAAAGAGGGVEGFSDTAVATRRRRNIYYGVQLIIWQ